MCVCVCVLGVGGATYPPARNPALGIEFLEGLHECQQRVGRWGKPELAVAAAQRVHLVVEIKRQRRALALACAEPVLSAEHQRKARNLSRRAQPKA